MKITWLGHSAFLLEESTGTTVVTDPYGESLVGYRMRQVSADAVTATCFYGQLGIFAIIMLTLCHLVRQVGSISSK